MNNTLPLYVLGVAVQDDSRPIDGFNVLFGKEGSEWLDLKHISVGFYVN